MRDVDTSLDTYNNDTLAKRHTNLGRIYRILDIWQLHNSHFVYFLTKIIVCHLYSDISILAIIFAFIYNLHLIINLIAVVLH